MSQAGRLLISLLMRSLEFFNLPNLSSSTIALEMIQSLKEWIPKIFLGG
jgi:hypothetical protein